MDSPRYTSISRKHLTPNKRHSSRSLNPDTQRPYRSKTPQPPPPKKANKNRKKANSPRRLLQYRARKDSTPDKEIEDELPNYIKATTPQPHMTNSINKRPQNININITNIPQIALQRSKSGNNINTTPPEIPQFSPMEDSMFTFVKSQYSPDFFNRNRANSNSKSNVSSNYNNIPLPSIHSMTVQSNNTTPIPMVHNKLPVPPPPRNGGEYNHPKIHQIPKPPPRSMSLRRGSNSSVRGRADSGTSNASMTPTADTEHSVSHSHKTPKSTKSSPKDSGSPSQSQSQPREKRWSFLKSNKKHKKSKKHSKKRNSRSNSKPFNDEDHIQKKKRDSVEEEQIFANKLHPSYTPLAPPKSTPPQSNNAWQHIPQIKPNVNPIPTLPTYDPMQAPHSYILPIHSDHRLRSNSAKSEQVVTPSPYPLDNPNSALHQHSSARVKSKTVGDYEDQQYVEEHAEYSVTESFMDDREVAHKSFAYNRSLRPHRDSPHSVHSNDEDKHMGQSERELDKMRFRCDQLDWNLSTLQGNTDRDIRQITAKMHRVEHDMKTQHELQDRSNGHGRRNSIFNSLESSIGAVMRNVDSIKDALQTLDLRMSIINQRQHDIFKHIDETKDILDTAQAQNAVQEHAQPSLVLNSLETATLSSRRASLQSMSEMLRLQSTRSMSIQEESASNSNPLILPTYDDNEDILNPESATKKKLMGHIRPELLMQTSATVRSQKVGMEAYILPKGVSNDVSCSASGDYGIAIERTRTAPVYGEVQPQPQEPQQQPVQPRTDKLESIVEQDDDDSSTESMLSQERNTAPISVPPMGDSDGPFVKQTSLSRRQHRHIRSSLDSGISDDIMSQIKYETMVIHSTDEEEEYDDNDSDEKALESNNKIPQSTDDVDEEKQYMINKENRRKKNKSRSKKRKRPSHSRSINVSMDDTGNTCTGLTLNNIDMKTLEVPVTNKLTPGHGRGNRKYSESYSINIYDQHNKNASTFAAGTGNMALLNQFKTAQRGQSTAKKASDVFTLDYNKQEKRRAGSMSYDIKENITYEREVSRTDASSSLINDLDPLGLKNRNTVKQEQEPLPDDEPDDEEDDSMSELSVDSMSDLSADHGTFVVHGDTLQQALQIQQEEEEKEQLIEKQQLQSARKCRKKMKKRMVQLMSCQFQLHVVPHSFTIINDFIVQELSRKPSYLLRICNNTASHDLFFKTAHAYNYSAKTKSLRYFRELTEDGGDTETVHIGGNMDESDDHLAPMEQMTFGDINIKKGQHYCGYFVFEAYPFLAGNDGYDDTLQTGTITPHNVYKNNPITPQLKPHAILNAIDEKQRHEFTQFSELKLGAMSPSTVNKYRRQSVSTTSRRTSLQFVSPKKGNTMSMNEHSVTSLLGRALDEDNGNNYPWNDDLDDLIDIVIGYDIELSAGDPQLNSFKCYIQFSEYAQPTYYQSELTSLEQLKSFCHGGSDGLQLSHNELVTKINLNSKYTKHPELVFNISYSELHHSHIVDQPSNSETLDIDTVDID